MTAATAMHTPTSSVTRKSRRPMSLRVALLAQRFDTKQDPLPTDVMVYRHVVGGRVNLPERNRRAGRARRHAEKDRDFMSHCAPIIAL